MGGWGTGRWGETRWGEGSGSLPPVDAQIGIEAACAAIVVAYVQVPAVDAAIEVSAACAVLTESTLPPPKNLRINAWLRPAL